MQTITPETSTLFGDHNAILNEFHHPDTRNQTAVVLDQVEQYCRYVGYSDTIADKVEISQDTTGVYEQVQKRGVGNLLYQYYPS